MIQRLLKTRGLTLTTKRNPVFVFTAASMTPCCPRCNSLALLAVCICVCDTECVWHLLYSLYCSGWGTSCQSVSHTDKLCDDSADYVISLPNCSWMLYYIYIINYVKSVWLLSFQSKLIKPRHTHPVIISRISDRNGILKPQFIYLFTRFIRFYVSPHTIPSRYTVIDILSDIMMWILPVHQ